MSRARSITLLHLSDPQFGPKHRFDGDSPCSLFARLRDDFEAMRARHGLVPDLVLITGDLVEYGKPSEFRQFRRFAEALAEHFGLPRRKIVLIPALAPASQPAPSARTPSHAKSRSTANASPPSSVNASTSDLRTKYKQSLVKRTRALRPTP